MKGRKVCNVKCSYCGGQCTVFSLCSRYLSSISSHGFATADALAKRHATCQIETKQNKNSTLHTSACISIMRSAQPPELAITDTHTASSLCTRPTLSPCAQLNWFNTSHTGGGCPQSSNPSPCTSHRMQPTEMPQHPLPLTTCSLRSCVKAKYLVP